MLHQIFDCFYYHYFYLLFDTATDCGPLTDPDNGKVTFDGTSVGSSVSYTCNDGFILSGNQRRQCLRTGNWTGSDPICRSK